MTKQDFQNSINADYKVISELNDKMDKFISDNNDQDAEEMLSRIVNIQEGINALEERVMAMESEERKSLRNVRLGSEIEFLNSDGMLENALVTYVDSKLFRIRLVSFCQSLRSFSEIKLSFYLSGKKTSRHQTNGNATRLVNM